MPRQIAVTTYAVLLHDRLRTAARPDNEWNVKKCERETVTGELPEDLTTRRPWTEREQDAETQDGGRQNQGQRHDGLDDDAKTGSGEGEPVPKRQADREQAD